MSKLKKIIIAVSVVVISLALISSLVLIGYWRYQCLLKVDERLESLVEKAAGKSSDRIEAGIRILELQQSQCLKKY